MLAHQEDPAVAHICLGSRAAWAPCRGRANRSRRGFDTGFSWLCHGHLPSASATARRGSGGDRAERVRRSSLSGSVANARDRAQSVSRDAPAASAKFAGVPQSGPPRSSSRRLRSSRRFTPAGLRCLERFELSLALAVVD